MNLIILKQEELEDLVQTSVAQTLTSFFKEKETAEKKSENLSVKQTAKLLNVSDLTIRNDIKKGIIKAERIGSRIIINRKQLSKSLKEVKSLKYRR